MLSFTTAGYRLTHWIAADDERFDGLPDRILTCSHDLTDFLLDRWVFAASPPPSAFGIDGARLPLLREWANATLHQQWGWPGIFYTPAAAREFWQLAQPQQPVILLGLATPSAYVDALLRSAPDTAQPGGLAHMLAQRQPPEPGGVALGFELLQLDGDFLRSWHSRNLAPNLCRELAIPIATNGLLATLDAAQACAEQLFAREQAELTPWLLTQYAL